MTQKVGSNPAPVTRTATTTTTTRQTQTKQPKETVPVGKPRTTTTHTVDTNGAETEIVMDGQNGGMTINIAGDCNECRFESTTINDQHVEVQGDNNGQISTGNESSNISTTGNNSPAGVSYNGDVMQATGKNAQINKATVDYMNEHKIPKAVQDRLLEQDADIQGHCKADMTSLSSKAYLVRAKMLSGQVPAGAIAEADKLRQPASVEEVFAEGSKFDGLDPKIQKELIASGIPASAIASICQAEFTDYVKFDKNTNQLKVANMFNGMMLTFDTSDPDAVRNLQLGSAINQMPGKEASLLMIDGPLVDIQYGFYEDDIDGKGIMMYTKNNGQRIGTKVILSPDTPLKSVTVRTFSPDDRLQFAEFTDQNRLLNGEKAQATGREFTVNIKPEAIHNGQYYNKYLLSTGQTDLKDGDKVKYNPNISSGAILINGDKNHPAYCYKGGKI